MMTTNTRTPCVFIVGPTCVGKTKLGVALAEVLNGEIISVDSLQCYANGALITAQPRADETKDIPHHLIGYLADEDEPHDGFVPRAMDALASIQTRGKAPLFVGGSTSLLLPTLHRVLDLGHPVQVLLLSPVVSSPEYERQARKRIDEMVSNGLIKELMVMHQREITSGTFRPSSGVWQRTLRWLRDSFGSCQRNGTANYKAAGDSHVGVWKTIGYPEMLPYLQSLLDQDVRPDLKDHGLEACLANTVRYAEKQGQWLQQTLMPFLHMRGIPFTSLPVPFDAHAWRRDVERRALRIVEGFYQPSAASSEAAIGDKAQDERHPVVCVFGGSSSGVSAAHSAAARSLATAFHHRGIHMVYGGGITGIMGAIATELVRLSGPQAVHGIIPLALAQYEAKMCALSGTEIRYEERLHGRRTVVMDMHTRKGRMVQEVQRGGDGSGFVAMSGGYGTAEELMEMVTWRQLGIHHRPVCAFNTDGLYDGLVEWLGSITAAGFVSARDAHLLEVSSSAEGIIERLFRPQEVNPHNLEW